MRELLKNTAAWFDSKEDKIIEDFFELLRFKSISTDPEFKSEVLLCADWIENFLKECSFTVERWQDGGHPCLFAKRIIDPSAPTILIYNHYDVQPVDPIELWDSPPFEPQIRNGEVYARGAEDNKGQCFYVLQALKALNDLNQFPKVNVKLLIEGEEECGSKTLPAILNKNSEALKADYLFVVDAGFTSMETPAINLGCRGIISMTVTARGANGDLHSGEHGGVNFNPLHALVEILGKARSAETGEILIPGFYDEIEDMSEEEKKSLSLEISPEFYRKMFDGEMTGGEKRFSPLESAWLRPTLEVNGISGGYAGPGFKTVIPARAIAKVSSRLVPNQDPKRVAALIADFFEKNAPPGITVSVTDISDNGDPFRTSPHTKIADITRKAYEEVLGIPCGNILVGGSIPIVIELAKTSGASPILMGYGLPDDQIHAPNEHFGIDRIKKGMLTIACILALVEES